MNTNTATTAQPSRGLHLGLWIVQVLLAFAFGAAGLMKSTTPIAELGQKLPWVLELPNLARFIGVSELAGALGLVLPSATRIQPKLTGIAAAALVLVMVLAAGFHAMKGEYGALPVNVVLGALAGFVAWGRLKAAPIAPKS